MSDDPDGGAVERVRRICLALPEVTERPSHGEPAWFVAGRRMMACLDDHHHGADHLAVWCAAPPGAQEELVAADPGRFFRPPYVGARGWVGVRVDRDPDWAEVAEVLADAHRQVAPRRHRQEAPGPHRQGAPRRPAGPRAAAPPGPGDR